VSRTFFGVAMARVMTMVLAMSVTVIIMLIFIPREHRNNMRHGRVTKGCKIEVDDDKRAEEYPQEYVDQVSDLYPAYNVDRRTEQVRIPQEEPRDQLERDKGHHNHEIGDLLQRVEFVEERGVVGILVADHNTPAIKLGLIQCLFAELYRVVQGWDIYLDVPCDKIINNPYEIIKQEKPPQQAVNCHRSLKREKVDRIAEFYLGAREYKKYKCRGIHPMPDPDR